MTRATWGALALSLTLPLLPLASANASGDEGDPRGSAAARPRDTGSYRNPLAPRLPTGGTVDSCADPAVLRGRGDEARSWFMYCTTDPLNDAETSGPGAPDSSAFHPIPTLRSTDLTHWTYTGDALPDKPSWAADEAFLWAPDVVWSRTHDRYYLTFVVTDTADEVTGEPGCTTDSAIGVATSDSPTGPWEVSDSPVVAPRRAGPGCDFYWTFDPDVLGNSVTDHGLLYYGSYYGGVFAQRVRLTREGMALTGAGKQVTVGQDIEPTVNPLAERLPAAVARRITGETSRRADEPTARQITVGNRYEGTNVVRRRGWYYLFASATNCCAGPRTGYSVFAGRSRSPMGPFVDREGNSLMAARVGGTPVLSMNGNRWVGAGHSSAFRTFDGQWWMAYHAADRTDPYFATEPGFTKRPALLDPLDWVDGWPSVRSGRWASDRRMPAPAAQPGEHTAYRAKPVRPDRLGRRLERYSDSFRGTALSRRWSWVRQPAASTYGVENGAFRFDTQAGDLFVDSNTASVLHERAPRGNYVVQIKVNLDVPPAGCCHNFVQAGLVVYGSDDAFVKLTHAAIWETRQTEFGTEVPRAEPGAPRYGNTVVGPPGDNTWLRIVHRSRTRAAEEDRYTAYTSQDGRRWVRGGTWTNNLGSDARIGLVSMGGAGFTARFDHVRVWRLR